MISTVVAALLVAVATLARVVLDGQLGALSPFMLYVAAVLGAGLVRGPLCGALVMLGGGVCGLQLFLSPHHVDGSASIIALMIFWGVSALVLVTANELRVHLNETMRRLSAAIERRGGGHTAS